MKFLDNFLSPESFSSDIAVWVVPGLVGLLLLVIVLLLGDDSASILRKRIKRAQGSGSKTQDPTQQAISIRRKEADSDIAVVDMLIKKFLPRPQLLRDLIARTGLKITLGAYLAVCAGVFAVATIGSFFLPLIPTPAAPLIGLVSGLGLPYFIMNFLANRRRNKFIDNFPEAIDLMVRGLKSGLPLGESIKIAGDEIIDPVGIEFRQISDSIRVGKKMEEALLETAQKLNMQEFNFMTVAMSIQAETGGNLSETLSNLSDVLRKRRQLKLKIRALSSEAKTSAYIIGSLPFIMTILIHLTNPGYLDPLWTDPRGHMAVAGRLIWFGLGIGIMYKMVKFEI